MKKPLFILIIFFLLLGVGAFLFLSKDSYDKEDRMEGLVINYINEGEGIEVLDNSNIVYRLTISEFKAWAKENFSDIFEEPPSFGELREVEIDNFYNFSNTAVTSPLRNYLAFSVSDYAALTDISFIGIVDLNKKEISLVDEENIGAVQTMLFSPDENYIAYALDTARAGGDYLTVDNVVMRNKEFTLKEEDVLSLLDDEICEDFTPEFSNLYFINSNELYFTTRSCNEENLEWAIDIDNKNLKKIKREAIYY